MFSRLFNFGVCKAQLENVSKFFCINAMAFLSLIPSISAIGVAAYVGYNQSDIIDQVYI